jgi:hypothetical protein
MEYWSNGVFGAYVALVCRSLGEGGLSPSLNRP